MTGTVWYAILLYILGMAVVLYLRPAIMFKPSGVWKEFGVGTTEGFTVFPFWMFSIVWAVASYAIVTVSSVFVSSLVMKSDSVVPNMANNMPVAAPISQATYNAVPAASMPPVVTNTNIMNAPIANISKKLPGYYILENLPEGPRYVYWGTDAPTMQNVIVRQSF